MDCTGEDEGVGDNDGVVTVLDRLTAAGLSRDSIDRHLAADGITVDGVVVSDLATPAPPPARVVLQG